MSDRSRSLNPITEWGEGRRAAIGDSLDGPQRGNHRPGEGHAQPERKCQQQPERRDRQADHQCRARRGEEGDHAGRQDDAEHDTKHAARDSERQPLTQDEAQHLA